MSQLSPPAARGLDIHFDFSKAYFDLELFVREADFDF